MRVSRGKLILISLNKSMNRLPLVSSNKPGNKTERYDLDSLVTIRIEIALFNDLLVDSNDCS